MSNINWTIPFTFDGLEFPTYGNFGGPGYSGGPTGTAGPVDALDVLFQQHDAGTATTDPVAVAAADLALLNGIVDLKPHDVDAEGNFYAGFAALAMVEQLALENALPAPKDLAHDVTVAVHDIERGFHQLAPADLAALAVYAEQPNLLPAVETLVDDIASVAPHTHVPTHSLDLLFA